MPDYVSFCRQLKQVPSLFPSLQLQVLNPGRPPSPSFRSKGRDYAERERLKQKQGCFAICGRNVEIVARQICKSEDALTEMDGVKTVTLNRGLTEAMLREYLVDSPAFSIELYEEKCGDWILSKSGSPGDLGDFEEDLCKNGRVADMPVLMSIVTGMNEGQRTIGVAFVDDDKHEIGINQFVDDEALRTLECMFTQLGIKECIVPAADPDLAISRIKAVAQACQLLIVERPIATFRHTNLSSVIARKCQDSSLSIHKKIIEQPLVQAALSGLLSYYPLLQKRYGIRHHTGDSFLKLNRSTQKALNIFPASPNEPLSHSLYGLLNKCKTPMGKRCLKTWLRQPSMDKEEIEVRLDVVEAFVETSSLRKTVPLVLKGMADLSRFLRRLESNKISLSDMFQLYSFSRKLPNLLVSLRAYKGPHESLFGTRYVQPLIKLTDERHLGRFVKFFEVAIDSSRLPEEFVLAPRYDKRLMAIQKQRTETEARINAAAVQICRDLELVMDKSGRMAWYKCDNVQRRCMKMSCKDERPRRRKLQSHYIVLETLKDGVKFTNNSLKKLSENLTELKWSYEEVEKELMTDVNDIAASFLEVFEDAVALVTEVDVLSSLAQSSVNAPTPYTRPKMTDPNFGKLEIVGGRHPIVEPQSDIQFVSNDCEMIRGQSWFQFITGPNMGGKSTYIRQIGIIVLMAHIGCFVPCSSAVIPIRDAIFARVGASDSQQEGISTFMMEMLDASSIFKGATDRSLVIIDELGRGTSTCDGLGLAWSISHHIMTSISCPTLFATHFHELTKLEHPIGVKNLHAQAEVVDGRLHISFKILGGASDKSFGIHVAKTAGFPMEVVRLAEQWLDLIQEGDKQ